VSPSEVEIRVHDSGVGIPEPLRDRVFEPFVTTKRQGTGLGLAIVRAIVQAHGGQVRLETPQERGAAFRVTLPAC
jgi:signal transduction histidine kinase